MYQISNATNFLGKASSRYFSEGFRKINFHYYNLNQKDQHLSVEAAITWDTSWIANSRQMHLGGIEYIAVACSICEHLLVTNVKLSDSQLKEARIGYCKMKLSSCLMLQQGDRLRIHGELTGTTSAGHKPGEVMSTFEVTVGQVLVKVGIVHLLSHTSSIAKETAPINPQSMFNHGYKQRIYSIREINCDAAQMNCIAALVCEAKPSLAGLGSMHHTLLPTDIVAIAGQLTQILLCVLEGKRKEELSNIWLRELDISFTLPPVTNVQQKMKVRFKKFKKIRLSERWWRAVDLDANLPDAVAKFKIAHELGAPGN